jgi:hypothetical protein
MTETTFDLVRALSRRTIKQNYKSLLVMPFFFIFVSVAFVLAAGYFPQILTGPTYRSLVTMSEMHKDVSTSMASSRAWSALFLQVPYLLTFLSSTYLVSLLSSSLIAETHKGGLEMLLAEPYRPGQIVSAFFWNSVLLSCLVWATVGALFLLSVLVLSNNLSLHLPHSLFSFFTLAVLLPLAGMLWSGQIILAIHLASPKLSTVRVGSNRSLISYVATLPSVMLMLVITFSPALNPLRVALIALATGFIGAMLTSSLLSLLFKPSRLLESS